MKVIVCGAGLVGFNIARYLSSERNDVTVIDQSPDLIKRVSDQLDVQGIVGFASHPDVLDAADAGGADVIIAVTQRDEVNMVACQVAHGLFNIPTKIARVRAQNYLDPVWSDLFTRENLPIDVTISPEIEVARAVMRRLQVPGAIDMVPFADGKVQVIATRLNEGCPVVDTPLRRLTELFPDLHIRVMGIVRDQKVMALSGDSSMFVSDEVYFAAEVDHVPRALAAFGHEEVEARRVLIVGGGNVGLSLAREIEEAYPRVSPKIIEHNRERAGDIAEQLQRTVVLCGDVLDRNILNEANVQATETVVAVTNDDEVNILASLLAKSEGCERAITLINNVTFEPLLASLGIDVVVNPRAITVSRILQYVRRGRIRGVHSLRAGLAEIIEAEAMETSSMVGVPIRDVDLPGGMVAGAVIRGDEVIIPRGSTVIQPKDRVVIFTIAEDVKHLEKMFSVRLEYF
ncbi:MAG: Trk system potassium transporter TrkA [Alphaproteobacteria bacterium]|nr:Trk system potassium transporter TrkA [Alphaproteobacteria bacterium]